MEKTKIGIGHLIRAMQMHGFGHEEIMAMREALYSGDFSKIDFCSDVYTDEQGSIYAPPKEMTKAVLYNKELGLKAEIYENLNERRAYRMVAIDEDSGNVVNVNYCDTEVRAIQKAKEFLNL